MKIEIPNRHRLLIIIAAVGLLLLILDAVLFEPLIGVWKANAIEITRLQKSVNDGRALVARGPQLERTWADMQANALAKEPAQAEQDVISAFDRWGRANQIELGSIRPQWKRGATDRSSLLECRVDATGTISSLSRFLYELERSPLALRVDSVELSARDDSGYKLTLALVVSGLRLSPLERK